MESTIKIDDLTLDQQKLFNDIEKCITAEYHNTFYLTKRGCILLKKINGLEDVKIINYDYNGITDTIVGVYISGTIDEFLNNIKDKIKNQKEII